MEKTRSNSKRVWMLDELRGLCVLFMVFFHGAYDIVYVFGRDLPWFRGWVMQEMLQPLDAGLFIFLAGFSSNYSRNNIKRGAVTLGSGMIITLITYLFMPSQLIKFGILHGLGTFMLLFALVDWLANHGFGFITKIKPIVGLAITMLLFAVAYRINNRTLGFFNIEFIKLPESWYTIRPLVILGFPYLGFSSADYFPILPWVLLFMAGTYFGKWIQEGNPPDFLFKSRVKPLSWIGQHSLIIYMLHQPLLQVILFPIFKFILKQ